MIHITLFGLRMETEKNSYLTQLKISIYFLVEPFNLTTKTLYYDTEKGIKISEYISGSDLTVAPLVEADLDSVSNILRELHALKIEGVDFDPAPRLVRYEKTLLSSLSEEYYRIKAFWLNELNTTYKDVEHVFLSWWRPTLQYLKN